MCINKSEVKVKLLSHVQLFATPWTVAYQAPRSIACIFQARVLEWVAISFSRGSSWPRDWTQSPVLQKDSLLSEPSGKPLQYVKFNPKQKRSNILCLGEWSELLNFIKIQLSFYRRKTSYFIELRVVVNSGIWFWVVDIKMIHTYL